MQGGPRGPPLFCANPALTAVQLLVLTVPVAGWYRHLLVRAQILCEKFNYTS